MFHSFHALHRRCEGKQPLANFTNFVFKLGNMPRVGLVIWSCAAYIFLNIKHNRDFYHPNRQIRILGPFMEFKLITVGI